MVRLLNLNIAVAGRRLSYGKTFLKNLQTNVLPQGFQITNVLRLDHNKTIVIETGFSAPIMRAIHSFVSKNEFRIAVLPFKYIIICRNQHPKSVFKSSKDELMRIKLPVSSMQKAHVALISALFSPDQPDQTTIMLPMTPREFEQFGDPLLRGIQKTADPIGYYAAEVMRAFKGTISETDRGKIEKVIQDIPPLKREAIPIYTLARMVRAAITLEADGPPVVTVDRLRQSNTNSDFLEINIIGQDYFGLSHDITSVLKRAYLELLEMDFIVLGKGREQIICQCTARANSKQNLAALQQRLSELMAADRRKRTSLDEGEKMWFSFVNLLLSSARLLRSLDQNKKVEDTTEIIRKYHPISREIVYLLRRKTDPAFKMDGHFDEEQQIEEINCHIQQIETSDPTAAHTLKFFLAYARSIKTTDYFDYRRLRGHCCFVLDASLLSEYIQSASPAAYLPSEITYIYKPFAEIELVPSYPIEERHSGDTYIATSVTADIPDPSFASCISSRAQAHAVQVLKIAKNVLPDPDNLPEQAYHLFSSMTFARGSNVFGIRHLPMGGYFPMATRALFSTPEEDGLPHTENIFLFDIAAKLGIPPRSIENIQLSFLGEGGLRNISKVTFQGNSYGRRSFIIAINQPHSSDVAEGHSMEEFRDLLSFAALSSYQGTFLLPQPFGFLRLQGQGQKHGTLYKEYLLGRDGQKFYDDLRHAEPKERLFKAAGRSIGRLYEATGRGSDDFKLANTIIYQNLAKFCDIASLERDPVAMTTGMVQAHNQVEAPYRQGFIQGIIEGGREKGREYLQIISGSMEDYVIECLAETDTDDSDDNPYRIAANALRNSIEEYTL